MDTEKFWGRIALGAAAGIAGTVALQVLRNANQRWLPDADAPINEDPGQFMLRKAKRVLPEQTRQRVPPKAEQIGSKVLAMGYGATLGVLYATARPQTRRGLTEGLLLGLAAWAIGYLGWLPATGLMPPVWRHKPKQLIRPVTEHALYGLATVAGYRWLQKQAAT